MSIESRATTKTHFQTGDKPTQAQFENFIDSAIFNEDYSANSTVVFKNSSGTITYVSVGASTIVGRKATGEIVALTASEVKTILALVKGDVGLGNVDNTSDVNKPVSTAQAAADAAAIVTAQARSGHTGTQTASTISDFNTAALAAAPAETTTTIGALINGATDKATPVDADYVGLMDSAAANIMKKLSWANIKATLKTYFDTLYQPLAAALTSWASVTRASGFDAFVATPSSANLATLITDEGTAFNKSFGTGTSNVPEIGATLGNSHAVQTNGSGKLTTSAAVAEADIASTITWSGTTAPSSLAAAKEWSYTIGKLFVGFMRLEYDVAGTALTNLSVVFPAGWPTPMSLTEWDNSETAIPVNGLLAATAAGTPATSRAWIEKTGGGAYRVSVQAASSGYGYAMIQVTFLT